MAQNLRMTSFMCASLQVWFVEAYEDTKEYRVDGVSKLWSNPMIRLLLTPPVALSHPSRSRGAKKLDHRHTSQQRTPRNTSAQFKNILVLI